MTIRDQGKFEELVGCIGHKKPRRLQPLDTNAGQDGFLSERAMRKKFLEERKQRMEEQCAAEVEAMKRAVKWRIADMHAERDRREAARMAKIKEEQEGFIADVDQFLKNKLEQDVLSKRELLSVWEKEVYTKIEKQTAKKLHSRESGEINRRLNDQMDKYVDAVASKTLFRDIIIESEYNPFEAKAATITMDARPRSKTVWDGIKDPLNEQIEKVMEIHLDKTAAEMPIKGKEPGKATLALREWATGVIEDTPHGFAYKFFEKSLADANLTYEQKQQRAARNISTMKLDHYDFPMGKEAMSKEYPKGKRCFPNWKPGQGLPEDAVKADNAMNAAADAE